jgi:hypothetical protein
VTITRVGGDLRVTAIVEAEAEQDFHAYLVVEQLGRRDCELKEEHGRRGGPVV